MGRALYYFRSESRESMKPVDLGNVFARGVRSIVTVSDATEDRGRAVRRAHFYAWPPPYDPNNWRARTHFNFGKRQRPAEKNFLSSLLRTIVPSNPRGPISTSRFPLRLFCQSFGVGVQGSTVLVFGGAYLSLSEPARTARVVKIPRRAVMTPRSVSASLDGPCV